MDIIPWRSLLQPYSPPSNKCNSSVGYCLFRHKNGFIFFPFALCVLFVWGSLFTSLSLCIWTLNLIFSAFLTLSASVTCYMFSLGTALFFIYLQGYAALTYVYKLSTLRSLDLLHDRKIDTGLKDLLYSSS